jgi:hypothetical protein
MANRASESLERKPRRLWFCRKVLFSFFQIIILPEMARGDVHNAFAG